MWFANHSRCRCKWMEDISVVEHGFELAMYRKLWPLPIVCSWAEVRHCLLTWYMFIYFDLSDLILILFALRFNLFADRSGWWRFECYYENRWRQATPNSWCKKSWGSSKVQKRKKRWSHYGEYPKWYRHTLCKYFDHLRLCCANFCIDTRRQQSGFIYLLKEFYYHARAISEFMHGIDKTIEWQIIWR